jgi:DNA anti-recombination protein RmuC
LHWESVLPIPVPCAEPVETPVETIPTQTAEAIRPFVNIPAAHPVKAPATTPEFATNAERHVYMMIPAAILLLCVLMMAVQRMRDQDIAVRELQSTLAQNAAQQASHTESAQLQTKDQAQALIETRQQMQLLQQRLGAAEKEISSTQESSRQRETELTRLVDFLKAEIEAAETQRLLLEKALREKTPTQVKKALP